MRNHLLRIHTTDFYSFKIMAREIFHCYCNSYVLGTHRHQSEDWELSKQMKSGRPQTKRTAPGWWSTGSLQTDPTCRSRGWSPRDVSTDQGACFPPDSTTECQTMQMLLCVHVLTMQMLLCVHVLTMQMLLCVHVVERQVVFGCKSVLIVNDVTLAALGTRNKNS